MGGNSHETRAGEVTHGENLTYKGGPTAALAVGIQSRNSHRGRKLIRAGRRLLPTGD